MAALNPNLDLVAYDASPDDEGNSEQSYPNIYYRKPDTQDGTPGDVVTGPGYPVEFMQRSKEGWKPLQQFGEFFNTNAREPNDNRRLTMWKILTEPYRRILLHPDGPAEFSARQIMEHGWHRMKQRNGDVGPYRGINWTDEQRSAMAEALETDERCVLCGKFFLTDLDLNKHQTVAHKEHSANEKLARVMAQTQGAGDDKIAEALHSIADVVASQERALNALAERQAHSDERFEKLLGALVAQNTQAEPTSKRDRAAVPA